MSLITAYLAGQELGPLITAGAALNERDDRGQTCLTLASSAGDIATVSLLLLAGANKHITDHSGATAEGMAAFDMHGCGHGMGYLDAVALRIRCIIGCDGKDDPASRAAWMNAQDAEQAKHLAMA